MLTKYKNEILLLLISVIFSSIITIIIIKWSDISSGFFDLKLSDLLELIIVGILTLIANYSINIESNKDIKKRELIISLFDLLAETVQKSYIDIYDFMDLPQDDKKNKVLLAFKSINNKIDLLKSSDENKIIFNPNEDLKDIIDKYSTMKTIVTGNSWGTSLSNLSYSKIEKDNFEKEYNSITFFIFQAKLKIYK